MAGGYGGWHYPDTLYYILVDCSVNLPKVGNLREVVCPTDSMVPDLIPAFSSGTGLAVSYLLVGYRAVLFPDMNQGSPATSLYYFEKP